MDKDDPILSYGQYKWTFPADIELEYQIPPGSNSVAEVAKCVHYCQEALT